MPPADSDPVFWIAGYDFRVWPLDSEARNLRVQASLDPTVWRSARELSGASICDAYGVSRISDISNGFNLAILPPPRPTPPGFVAAAFDAPAEIIAHASQSFGLQHSLEAASNTLATAGFHCLGFDVVDLWTQRTALYPNDVFEAMLHASKAELNEWGLFPTPSTAARGCLLANQTSATASPFQPVGVWIRKE